MEITGVSEEVAIEKLEKFKRVKNAIFSILANIDDAQKIEEILQKHNGNIRESLEHISR